MPFQKGNKYGALGKGVKRTQWEALLLWLHGEGGRGYLEMLQDLKNGKELSKPQKEYMEHYEKLLEFHKPKLARTEVSGIDNQPIAIKLSL
jgi:hypothetical protein